MLSRSTSRRFASFGRVLMLTAAWAFIGAEIQPASAETPDEAIRRIRAGQHTPMPPPTTAPASGPAGKGMTIENGTGHILQVHFSGPVSRTVVVQDGKAESVELAVGDYHVAAEVPASPIVPFYGRHVYQPYTHYWLKFYTQRPDSPQKSAARSESAPPGSPANPVGVVASCKAEQQPSTYSLVVHYSAGQSPHGIHISSGALGLVYTFESPEAAFCSTYAKGVRVEVDNGCPNKTGVRHPADRCLRVRGAP